MGSQAGVVDINHAFHLYYNVVCGLSFSRSQPDFEGFLRALRFPPYSKLTPSLIHLAVVLGMGVVRSHTWIVFRGRMPNRQHSSFGPTSLSCALCNSVYGLRERVISRSSSSSNYKMTIGKLEFKKNWKKENGWLKSCFWE